MVRSAFLSVLLLVGSTPLLAQRDPCRRYWSDDDRPHLCRTIGLGARSTGSLQIDPGVNGGVEVEAWDGDSIEVEAYVQSWARSDDDAKSINTSITISLRSGVLSVDGPTVGHSQGWAVNFEVRVPRHQDLSISATNGPIGVSDVTGTMRLETTNGPITLDGAGGDVRARLQNGPLTISLLGTGWEGAGLDAETVNGPLTIQIPTGYNATLVTGTQNGPFHTDIPITVQGNIGRVGQAITTTLGHGGVSLRAVTTNGPLTIRSGR